MRPTVAQTLPGYEVTSFEAIAAPRGVPPATLARLNRELHGVLARSEVKDRLTATGGEVSPGSDLGRHVAAEISKWKRVVAEKKIEIR